MTSEYKSTFPDFRVKRLKPFGLLIQSDVMEASLDRLDFGDLRRIILFERLLVLRGIKPFSSKTSLANYCRQWNELLEWDFGEVFEVVEQDDPQNYLFTSGSVPYHWDGAFAERTPWLQFFQCVDSPGKAKGGETIFCDTARVWEAASSQERQLWEKVTIKYSTDKVSHYGGEIEAPLVDSHPTTRERTLRFAEPANKDTVRLNTPELVVDGPPEAQEPAFLENLIDRLYQPEFVYAHKWNSGDLVVADNHVLLHGRNPYHSKLPRKLWRVHIL